MDRFEMREETGWLRSAGELELERDTADDALGRTDDEQLVVDRLIARDLSEEITDGEEHFPLRRAEVHERQRLPDLHVESRVELLMLTGGAHGGRIRKSVADTIENHDAR